MFAFLDQWRERRFQERQAWEKARILELEALLLRIPAGRDLVRFAKDRSLRILFSTAVEGHAAHRAGMVLLSRSSTSVLQPIFLAHELRHVWQERQGLSMGRVLNIADALVNNRFQEADAFSLEAQLAWELEQAGAAQGIWRRYARTESRLAQAFAQAVQTDPAAAVNGVARRAAFNEWFRGPHKDFYDAAIIADCRRQCENVSRGKRAYPGYDRRHKDGAPEKFSAAYLRGFGKQNDGENYLAAVDTYSDVYTGGLSKANARRVEKLAGAFDCLITQGKAVSLPAPSGC